MRLLRSGSIVLFSNCVDLAAILARNVLLARLLSVTEFGLAATFGILMTMVETFQNVGLNRLVVQDHRSDDPKFIASLHGAQIFVSILASAVLLLVAYLFALLTNTHSQIGAYLALSTVPLINAFTNLEVFRLQREGRFAPQALRSLLSQPLGLLSIFPAYWFFQDYCVALVAIITQQATAVILSHVGVGRRYRIVLDPAVANHAFRFGWPLVVNGLLMFFILNGDRIIVLKKFGPESLGWFSAALMLTMIPGNIIAKSLQTLALPEMAKSRSNLSRSSHLYSALIATTTLLALVLMLMCFFFGHLVIDLFFGPRFHPARAFVAPLAWLNGLRLFRAAPAIRALASGDTRAPLYTNIVRLAGVPIAFAIAATTGRIEAMILAGICAELVSACCAGMFTIERGDAQRIYYSFLALLSGAIALMLFAAQLSTYVALLLAPLIATIGWRLRRSTANRPVLGSV